MNDTKYPIPMEVSTARSDAEPMSTRGRRQLVDLRSYWPIFRSLNNTDSIRTGQLNKSTKGFPLVKLS